MSAGVLAEFDTPKAMLTAIDALWERGYRELDAFTPYPVRGLERALRLRRSPINWMIFVFAVLGACVGYALQWWMNARDYPLDVGGRPPHAAPAFVPITFETIVLFSAVIGFLLFLALTRLPEPFFPEAEVEGFERATIDRFWIRIDARDPALVPSVVLRDLVELGALKVAWTGEEPR
jgi:hypothetical protein